MTTNLIRYIFFEKPEGLNVKGKRLWRTKYLNYINHNNKEFICISDIDVLLKMDSTHFKTYDSYFKFNENLIEFKKFTKEFAGLPTCAIKDLQEEFDEIGYGWQKLFLYFLENFSNVQSRVEELETTISELQTQVNNLEE
jgi:hypothetical protein